MNDLVKGCLTMAMIYLSGDGHHLRNIVKNPYDVERWFYPGLYTPTPDSWVDTDTWVPSRNFTPDFRLEEPYYTVYDPWFFNEYNRPYRLSPHYKQIRNMSSSEKPWLLSCYCATVYRKHHVLGTCAILTQRHILTTATSTDVVLRNYEGAQTLLNVLGIWYEYDSNVFNSSMYHAGPSRIHYHPKYKRDYETNITHPLPCTYDLAVWSTYYNLGGTSWWWWSGWPYVTICQRAGSSAKVSSHTIPRVDDKYFVIGYLFMKAYGRRPLPWFQYGVRLNSFVWPCPKSDWHWFHCVQGEWARYGFDSGGALHLMDEKKVGRNDGLAGICSFSMKLRSKEIVHYFTVVDTHPVLEFLYDAYMGYQKYEFLDARFYNWQGGAPRLLYQYHIPVYYSQGFQPVKYHPPNYRR